MPKNLECRNEFGIWSRARSPGIHAWQLSTGYVKNMKICEMKKNKDPPTPWGCSQIQNPPNSGFATAIPQGAPLSTEHFKNDDSALDGLQSHSEHLLIIVLFLFLRDMGRGLLSILLVSGHLLLQKTRTFGLGPPPRPRDKFQDTVPSHIKSCTAHSGGGGGCEAKNLTFWNGKHIFGKETEIQ